MSPLQRLPVVARTAPPALRARRLAILAAAAALAPAASAQITYSISYKSQSVSQLSSGTTPRPMTEGDLLQPPQGAPAFGPLPPPRVAVTGQGLSLQNYSSCVGHPAGTQCHIEIDGLSGGHDEKLTPGQQHGFTGGGSGAGILPSNRWRIYFSVDPYARGLPGLAGTAPHPQVFTEGILGAPPPFEACADIFMDLNIGSGPLPPATAIPDNVGLFDGNGLVSPSGFQYRGLGLLEPMIPTTVPPWLGDDIDALEIGTNLLAPGTVTYLTLDSAFVDPLTGLFNSGSAGVNGFRGGDLLATSAGPGGTLALYAPAGLLGLDRVPGFGPDSDDIDALAIAENGDGIYQPSQVPYDWVNGATDMVIFSVRRGSAVINQPDSIFGLPIQPGDLLTTPLPLSAGGVSPYPGLFIAAEHLGLFTARGNPALDGDEVDAIDTGKETLFDCNENGVEDAVDIATGASADANKNGIPDECEDGVLEFCYCATAPPAPCSNTYSSGGCANSTGLGAKLLTNIAAGGSTSVAADNLVFTGSQLPVGQSAILYMSATSKPAAPFDDGVRCVQSPFWRYAIQTSSPTGSLVYGPGVVAQSVVRFAPSGSIDPGEVWYFQCWYRDPSGPCGKHSNVSNVVRVDFVP